MIKLNYNPENPLKTKEGGIITEPVNIKTWYSPEYGYLNEQGQLQVLVRFASWYTSEYDKSGTDAPEIVLENFKEGKFRTFVDDKETPEGSQFAQDALFVFEFSRDYMINNYGIDPNIIEYLPM